jgi:hypothetical protein
LLNLKGDVGGRSIIEGHPEDVRVVPVKSIGVIKDVDTWPAYHPPPLPEVGREKKGVLRGRDEKGDSDKIKKRVG